MIGHLPHALQHLEGPRVARSQLPRRPGRQRACRAVEEVEPHPVPHRELQLSVVVVVVALRMLLEPEKPLTNSTRKALHRAAACPPPLSELSLWREEGEAVVPGCTPPRMVCRGGPCRRKYCNNTPPTEASRPMRVADPL
jgi:hypothetical protein